MIIFRQTSINLTNSQPLHQLHFALSPTLLTLVITLSHGFVFHYHMLTLGGLSSHFTWLFTWVHMGMDPTILPLHAHGRRTSSDNSSFRVLSWPCLDNFQLVSFVNWLAGTSLYGSITNLQRLFFQHLRLSIDSGINVPCQNTSTF